MFSTLALLFVAVLAVSAGVPKKTVADYIKAESCGTAGLGDLDDSLMAEMANSPSAAFVRVSDALIKPEGPQVHMLMEKNSAAALVKVARSRGKTMNVNSLLRTIAQQYTLYSWYLAGKCGITMASSPAGTSPHMAGIGIDVEDNVGWNKYFTAQGYSWQGSGDPMHFTYSTPSASMKAETIKAFQRWYNKFNVNQLSVDGAWGSGTEAALRASPVDGVWATVAPPKPPAPVPKTSAPVPNPPARPSDPQCVAWAGTCTDTCTGGKTFVAGLCPNFGASIKCCVPPSDPQCVAKAGTCTDTCTGSKTFVAGLCPNFGASIKCCVPNAAPVPTKAPAPVPNPPAPATSGMRTYTSTFIPSSANTKCTTPISKRVGECRTVEDCPGANYNGLCPGNYKCCVADSTTVTYDPTVIKWAAFIQAFGGIGGKSPGPGGRRADAMYAFLSKAMKDGGISSCLCKAAFMAQVGHESGGLIYFEELASGAAYEGRSDLGNVQAGDGVRYKGRGPVQLTGRANYASASKRLGVNFEADPERVCMPSAGFLTTVDFWNTNNLNNYCVNGGADEFITMTRRINGGTNGLSDRQDRYAAIRRTLGC